MKVAEGYSEVFKAHLIDELRIEALTLSVYENGIAHIKVNEYQSINRKSYELANVFLKTLGPDRRYHSIFEFTKFSDVDPDMRKMRATKEGTEFSLSDALVINNLPQKIIADFYMRFQKPQRPTKFFFSLQKATQWTFQQMTDKQPS